jgi:hypothetical protein
LKELVCGLRHLFYSAGEGEFVGLRGLCEAAEFANELQRRRPDFFVRCGRFEIVQGLDVSTHSNRLPIDVGVSRSRRSSDRAAEPDSSRVLHVF